MYRRMYEHACTYVGAIVDDMYVHTIVCMRAVCVRVCVYHTHLTPGQRRVHWMWDSALQSPSAVERVWLCLALKGKPHT